MAREHPLGWPRALHPRETPCRVDEAKGQRQHPCSDAHRSIVEGFRAWAESERQKEEPVTLGYATETAEYREKNLAPTFRAYLTGLARPCV